MRDDLADALIPVFWATGACTESDFQAWRDQRDWTEEKYRRFDRGERMPHDWQARDGKIALSGRATT